MDFGKRLERARKAKGWSQWDMAGELEITQRTVSRWERGETLPAMSVMESLAAALDVSLKWLMDGKEEKRLPCVTVPLLSPAVAAQCGGGAIVGEVQVEEDVWVPEDALGPVDPERKPFAILASGDCMEAGETSAGRPFRPLSKFTQRPAQFYYDSGPSVIIRASTGNLIITADNKDKNNPPPHDGDRGDIL